MRGSRQEAPRGAVGRLGLQFWCELGWESQAGLGGLGAGVPAATWDDRVLLCPRGAGAAGDGCAMGQPSNSYLGTLSHKTAERRWSSRCPGLSVGLPRVSVPTGPCLGCLLCLQPGSPEWAGSWASRPRAPTSVLRPRKLRRKGPQSPAPALEGAAFWPWARTRRPGAAGSSLSGPSPHGTG